MIAQLPLENLYTYAFLKTPTVKLNLPKGIFNQVVLIDNSGISAVVEPELYLDNLVKNDQQLIQIALDHNRVICEIFCQVSVLPLRLGTSFNSYEAILNYLKSHADAYKEKLDSLEGKSEYLLKLIPRKLEETAPVIETAGKQYFLAKKQRYKEQQDFQNTQMNERDNLIDYINQLYSSSTITQAESKGEEGRIYFLLSPQEESLLLENLSSWQQAYPLWDLQLGEALPPYHFI
ncbi:GvpL/GvpF family gas vesicle protein [Aetokthonos hydrillicola Thurmond2011]|jgi:hypothetical protein|uniref:GvpL/GvpF family gas vesicle protein n=1 Tax=Aetokthonos hydrillicola Thurmond2011 TaxID=2712845 RepID=A0AAP5M9C7_9CYAN|nr:GvpL/GvpF family gas vesicle protein [Aetokthonos hydrillicola]MBO3457736.1 gas vesicle protein [Aetokthonos hydrillicola CCALA 1050]MBW4589413.1 GvpL/GvpF family gas vesicle protein [Aetokthonos hydrillicola CCALA 1050]MDR9897110.1 GvpL/GvpF family gas vesicle protein [Aetokthonos hydrillicola Thurmond2011]